MLRRRDRDQGSCARPHLREARAQQEARIADEIGNIGECGAAVLLVTDNGVAAPGSDGDVVAGRCQIPPIEVTGVANDVIWPGLGRVAGVAKPFDASVRPPLVHTLREWLCPQASFTKIRPPDAAEYYRYM